jgi:ABC-2 type transport system permease protein
LPLVNLALWTTVARENPGGHFGRYGESDFAAYFMAVLIVRNLTGSWVVWQINQEVRMGTLSMRLLRPVHPFVSYSAEHLAAVPMRGLVALPIAGVLLVYATGGHLATDPWLGALIPVSITGAWVITFGAMLTIGALGMFMERSTAVFEVWLGAWAVLSGYLVPLELMPSWLQDASRWLPFRYMLGAPVELMTGMSSRQVALQDLGIQWAWALGFMLLASWVWRAGVRRFEAFGS